MGDALWRHRAWICCTLDWQGRRRAVMTGRRWTELFFLDEAVALAAGHRPCGYCRRAAFGQWKAAWARAFGGWPGVMAVDAALHEARAERGARRMLYDRAEVRALPDHAIFRDGDGDWLVLGDACHAVTPDGYGDARARPDSPVTVLTNPVTRAVLAAGYVPATHPTLGR